MVEQPSEENIEPVFKSKSGVGGLLLKSSPALIPKYQILASPCGNAEM